MCENYCKLPSRLDKKAQFAVLLLLTILSVAKASAQSQGFAPTPSRSKYSVSVRDLQLPPKAKVNFERGLQRLRKRDAEGSLKHFAAAIAAAPNFSEAYYNQGVAEAQLGQNDAALRSFQAAINLSEGHDPRAGFGYALVLCRTGDAVEAERIVRHGLQNDANIPDGYVVLSLVLLKLNRTEEAERSAQEALLLRQPSSAKAHLILADIRGSRGDFSGQARELSEYLEIFPDAPNREFVEMVRDTAKRLAAGKHSHIEISSSRESP